MSDTDHTHRFTCERCGIEVYHFLPLPPGTLRYCAPCNFVESILDPEKKKQAAEFIDRILPRQEPSAHD